MGNSKFFLSNGTDIFKYVAQTNASTGGKL